MPANTLTAVQTTLAQAVSLAQSVHDALQAAALADPSTLNNATSLLAAVQSAQSAVAVGASIDQAVTAGDVATVNLGVCQSQLAAAKSTAITQTSAAGTSPIANTSQTYVSAPAVGALMAVSAILGAAGGYAGKSYLDKQKHNGAREAPRRVRAGAKAKETGDA
jgi:hypothetical protein